MHHLELDVLHLDPQAGGRLQRQVARGDRLAVLPDDVPGRSASGADNDALATVLTPSISANAGLTLMLLHSGSLAMPMPTGVNLNRVSNSRSRRCTSACACDSRPASIEAPRPVSVHDQRVQVFTGPVGREVGLVEEILDRQAAERRRRDPGPETAVERGDQDRRDEEQEAQRGGRGQRFQADAHGRG